MELCRGAVEELQELWDDDSRISDVIRRPNSELFVEWKLRQPGYKGDDVAQVIRDVGWSMIEDALLTLIFEY